MLARDRDLLAVGSCLDRRGRGSWGHCSFASEGVG